MHGGSAPAGRTVEVSTNGMSRPTIRTVAEHAGVSIATVSYVLSGRSGKNSPGVSGPTAAKVRQAADELGYVPNAAARTTRTGRTNLILLSLTVLSDPWALAVIDAVRNHATGAGMTPMILADVDWTSVLPHQQADVVFIDSVSNSAGHRRTLHEMSARGQRIVVLSMSDQLQPDGFDVVRSLPIPGCDLLMQHLLRGHHKIACLATDTAPTNGSPSRDSSYLRAMKSAGIAPRKDYLVRTSLDALSAYDAAKGLLTLPDPPTAIFAVSDFAAISAVNAAQRLGLTVGSDIHIAGAGNTMEGERMTPSLTSTGPADFFDLLGALLVQRAESAAGGSGELIDFPWRLFARESAP